MGVKELWLSNLRDKNFRVRFIITILVACAVLVQHVHYSVDVIAAPFITYASYRIAYHINSRN